MRMLSHQQTQGWDIVGHEHAIEILRRTLAAQQVRHAYLFVGPEHIGKRLLVKRFAQCLLCTGGPDPTISPEAPCNVCLSCRKVLHGNHPDLHIIRRAADKQFILIEQVRELQNASSRRTMEGRRNIFILENVHEMNMQAANCLLKTLEEPEPDVILLLTVPDPGLLLPTIISRVQQIPMQLLSSLQIQQALQEHWDVEAAEAELLAALAAGRMGWAVQAVEDEDLLSERKSQLDLLLKIPTLTRVQRFQLVQQLGSESEKVHALLDLWLLWWRDMVLAANNCLDLTVNVDMRNQLKVQAAKIGTAEAERMIRAIIQTREALEQNVNARVALEVLMLDVPLIKS
jgi:DNA polymerase-3 subunit delta'